MSRISFHAPTYMATCDDRTQSRLYCAISNDGSGSKKRVVDIRSSFLTSMTFAQSEPEQLSYRQEDCDSLPSEVRKAIREHRKATLAAADSNSTIYLYIWLFYADRVDSSCPGRPSVGALCRGLRETRMGQVLAGMHCSLVQ